MGVTFITPLLPIITESIFVPSLDTYNIAVLVSETDEDVLVKLREAAEHEGVHEWPGLPYNRKDKAFILSAQSRRPPLVCDGDLNILHAPGYAYKGQLVRLILTIFNADDHFSCYLRAVQLFRWRDNPLLQAFSEAVNLDDVYVR